MVEEVKIREIKDCYIKLNKFVVGGKLGEEIENYCGQDILVSNRGIKLKSLNAYKLFSNRKNIMVKNVTQGYFLELYFEGIGYRFINLRNELLLKIGFSNYIRYRLPVNIVVFGYRKKLVLFSLNKNYLNRVGYLIRILKKIDIYKGKGIYLKGVVRKIKERKEKK